MTFRRASLWFLPVVALSAFAIAAVVHKPQVEAGLLTPKSGLVLDAQTQQPLAGAYVVVRWLEQSHEGASLEGRCLYHAVVRTDAAGRYSVPALQLPLAERTFAEHRYFWDSFAYAPGYGEIAPADRKLHPRTVGSEAPGLQSLEPILLAADRSAAVPRIATLADTLSRFECESSAERKTDPIAEQIYVEAQTAACPTESAESLAALARLRGARGSDAPLCPLARRASN